MTPSEKIAEARKLLGEAGRELSARLQNDRSRNRGAVVRELHTISRMTGESDRYFSQAGQDRIVDSILGHKEKGVFVDVGGYDGFSGSNTLFFELFRRWRGVLIEPAPTQLRRAEALRKCPCLGYAVAGSFGQSEFMEVTKGYTQMSGFLESYDPELLGRVRSDPRHEEIVHVLERRPLDEILRERDLERIDYVSLDVEGGEMDILQNFDFDGFEIELWSIENNTQDKAIPELMRQKGYDLIEFVGVDEIYRKRPDGGQG